MQMFKSIAFGGALVSLLTSFSASGSEARVEELEPFVRATAKSAPMGCNNFATLISGDTGNEESVSGGFSHSTSKTYSMVSGVKVILFRLSGTTWVKEASAMTGSDGHYEFCEVPNGTYRVRFCHSDFVEEFWNNKATFGASNSVVITNQHKQATGISALLEPGDGPEVCE